MEKFLVLYKAPISAREQMARATPEQTKAGMDAWMSWAEDAGDAIVDPGTPLGNAITIARSSVKNSSAQVVGYSILRADSKEAITSLLQRHPHGHVPDFSIEVFESLSLPGEAEKPSKAA